MSLGWGVGEHPCRAEQYRVPVGWRRPRGLRSLQVSLTQTFQWGCWLQAPAPFPRLEHPRPQKARGMASCPRGCLAHSSASDVAPRTAGESDNMSGAFPPGAHKKPGPAGPGGGNTCTPKSQKALSFRDPTFPRLLGVPSTQNQRGRAVGQAKHTSKASNPAEESTDSFLELKELSALMGTDFLSHWKNFCKNSW